MPMCCLHRGYAHRPPSSPPTGRPPPAPFGGKIPEVVMLADLQVQTDSANKEKLRVGAGWWCVDWRGVARLEGSKGTGLGSA